MCHRDLKPENLLLTSKGSDADVKIADFGLSKIMGEKTMMKRSCGTWAYWAPEILRRQPYDYSVDLWSVGVILYIMLSGIHPFDPDGQSSDAKIVERILRADYTFDPDYFAHVSPAAKDVVCVSLSFCLNVCYRRILPRGAPLTDIRDSAYMVHTHDGRS